MKLSKASGVKVLGLDGCSKREMCSGRKTRSGGEDDFNSMESCVSLAHHGFAIAQYYIYRPT